MEKKCERCGQMIESESAFCLHCGAPVGDSAPIVPKPRKPHRHIQLYAHNAAVKLYQAGNSVVDAALQLLQVLLSKTVHQNKLQQHRRLLLLSLLPLLHHRNQLIGKVLEVLCPPL